MKIRLCYKEYDAKMSLEAMKSFKEATGKDLWFSLINIIDVWVSSTDKTALARIAAIYKVMPFDEAAHLFHAMIKTENKRVPLQEIEDGMFRVGWRPSDAEHDFDDPWPILMYKLALDVDTQMSTVAAEKKQEAATLAQSSKS